MRRHVNLPEHEADDAKRNGNPGLSVHKEIGGGYSQTNPSTWDVAIALIDSGTGSSPCPPQGWQRAIRFTPSQLPRKRPCRSTASRK
jgi:hypothetical protein